MTPGAIAAAAALVALLAHRKRTSAKTVPVKVTR